MTSEHIGLYSLPAYMNLFTPFNALKISMKYISKEKYILEYRHSCIQLTCEITVPCGQQPPPPLSTGKHVLLYVFVDMPYTSALTQ
jgi:hypothetical protein